MATVKALLDEFCDRINQPRESSYVAATTPAARQYVSLFKKIGSELLDYQDGWDQLKRIYTFTTTTDVANYQLPGDYLRMLTGTQWSVTNQVPLSGPLSNARLAFQTYGVEIATPFATYQVNGAQGYIFNTSPYTQRSAGYFQISPPGQNDTDQNVIAYTSSNYVWPTDWLASTAGYVVGSKVTGVNNIYIATAITTGTSGTTRPSITSGTVVDGGVTWAPYHEPYAPTADTDIALLDDELFIEGLRWAWFEAKQQFAMAEKIEKSWRNKVRNALGNKNGAVAVNAGIDVTAQHEWPLTPIGDWAGTGDV
jgi:hypothetical protein